MKECRKCKIKKIPEDFYKDKRAKDGLYSYCKKCQDKVSRSTTLLYFKTEKWKNYLKCYMRKYTEKNLIKTNEAREKDLCRQKTRYAKRKGILKKDNCVICNSKNSEAHHEDYSKPLEVIWLCKKHHTEKHLVN